MSSLINSPVSALNGASVRYMYQHVVTVWDKVHISHPKYVPVTGRDKNAFMNNTQLKASIVSNDMHANFESLHLIRSELQNYCECTLVQCAKISDSLLSKRRPRQHRIEVYDTTGDVMNRNLRYHGRRQPQIEIYDSVIL